MTMERWDPTTPVTFDQQTWSELGSLRFIDAGHNAVIMGPVGVGKTDCNIVCTRIGYGAVKGHLAPTATNSSPSTTSHLPCLARTPLPPPRSTGQR